MTANEVAMMFIDNWADFFYMYWYFEPSIFFINDIGSIMGELHWGLYRG